MKKSSVKDILKRYKNASSGANNFYSMYKKCYELSSPNANNIDQGANKGSTNQNGVLDSTVSRASDSFVNTFITTIFPPQTRWMELEPSEDLIKAVAKARNLNEEDVHEELTAGYQYVTDRFFDVLNQSNFYSIIDQFAHDVFVGTGVILAQRANDMFNNASPVDFTAVPPLDIAVDVAPNQKITGVFRKTSVKLSDIQYVWPNFDTSVIKNFDSNNEQETTKEFIECCILEPIYVKTPAGKEIYKRWRYLVICEEEIGFEEYYKNNPIIAFFWNLRHGENVGRGLMTKLLPDALQLEAMVSLKNKWVQMYGLGMHSIVASKLFNPATAQIRPNAAIIVKEQGAIQPIQPAGNPQVQQLEIQQLQEAIRQTALDLNIPTDPNMTATQVNYIAQRQLQIFAGVVGRIQFQLLWPIVQTVLDILVEDGYLQLPEGLEKIDSRTTKLKILSPVGRVQNLNDLNSMMSALSYIAQIDPSLIQLYVKTEDLPTWIFNQTGSPAKFLRSDEETQNKKAEIEQQQMQLLALQNSNNKA
jgi:hypothetical protein